MDSYIRYLVEKGRAAQSPRSNVLTFRKDVLRDVERAPRGEPRPGLVKSDERLAPNIVTYEYGMKALFLIKGSLTVDNLRLLPIFQDVYEKRCTRNFGLAGGRR